MSIGKNILLGSLAVAVLGWAAFGVWHFVIKKKGKSSDDDDDDDKDSGSEGKSSKSGFSLKSGLPTRPGVDTSQPKISKAGQAPPNTGFLKTALRAGALGYPADTINKVVAWLTAKDSKGNYVRAAEQKGIMEKSKREGKSIEQLNKELARWYLDNDVNVRAKFI